MLSFLKRLSLRGVQVNDIIHYVDPLKVPTSVT